MASKRGHSALTAFVAFLVVPTVFAIPYRSWNDTTTQLSSTSSDLSVVSPTQASSATLPVISSAFNATNTSATAVASSQNSTAAVALDPNAADCFITLPDNALSATGLSTPIQLMPPCSMSVGSQQAFAEAAVIAPDGSISIYHPLIIDAGTMPAAAPVVPNLPAGASVALWFGFNGGTLQLLDTNGKDTNNSPLLANMKCVNGLPGVDGDVFGQVSWCNTDAFFSVANSKAQIPALGTDKNGRDCPSSRAFTVIDQDQSDNLPTTYLLLSDGTLAQNTAANKAKFPSATELDNASDEALIGDIIDPLIGCTPFQVPSLDDPGALVGSLATQELQAGKFQNAPVALVPLNDPDTILTSDGTTMSTAKTNAYRLGVNQALLGNGANTDDGSPTAYCSNMITLQPPFLQENQAAFMGAATPDDTIGNNLFTFLCNRYLQSVVNLNCAQQTDLPITCQLDGNGVATSCTFMGATTTSSGNNGGQGGPSSTIMGATTTSTGNNGGQGGPSSTFNGGQGSASSVFNGGNGGTFTVFPSQSQASTTPANNRDHHHATTTTTPVAISFAPDQSSTQGSGQGQFPPGGIPTSLVGPATITTSQIATPTMQVSMFGPTITVTMPAPPLAPGPVNSSPIGGQNAVTTTTLTTFQTVTVTTNAACTLNTSYYTAFGWKFARA